jgi:hypothetical protein
VVEPDQPLAALVDLILVADAAEWEGPGYRVERGSGDADLDHGVNSPT